MVDQQTITSITALIVALTTLLTTVVTLTKVLQHDVILKDTRSAVNGQAAALERVTDKTTSSLESLHQAIDTAGSKHRAGDRFTGGSGTAIPPV